MEPGVPIGRSLDPWTMTAPRQAFVGLGSNLGDRAATLRAAVERLRRTPGIERIDESPVYETDPVGMTDQPKFLNQVLGIETTLTPEALLQAMQEIERSFGRVRIVRWGPRTLDLDLLAYEGETRATDALTLPHPRMFERTFVTIPLGDLLARARFRRPAWEAIRAKIGVKP